MDEQYNFLLGHENNMDNEILKNIKKETEKSDYGSITYKLKGTKNVMGYSHLINNWILICNVPSEETYLELKKQLLFSIAVILIVVIAITGGATYLVRAILKPIIKLTEIIKNTSNFDFTKKIR